MSEVEDSLPSILKTRRESLNLSIADIDKKLKITEQNISKLENEDEDFKNLSIFQRGYLRNYLKLLGLPEEQFAIAFTNADKISSELFEIKKPFYKKRVILSRKNLNWIVIVVVLLLIAIFGF